MTGTSEEFDELIAIYWPVAAAVMVIVVGLVAFVVWRFRSEEDGPAGGRESNHRAEGAYAAGLATIAAALLFFTFDTQSEIEEQFEAPAALEVEVSAARWNWRFTYSGRGVVEQGTSTRIPTLFVPRGEPVRFTGESIDVIHSFWIPSQRFKRDLFPARETSWQLSFDEEGFETAGGRCAEFCGLRHSAMLFNVSVLEPAEFDRWLAEAAAEQEGRGVAER